MSWIWITHYIHRGAGKKLSTSKIQQPEGAKPKMECNQPKRIILHQIQDVDQAGGVLIKTQSYIYCQL